MTGAQKEVPKYPQGEAPEPAFILTLSNEVYTGASLFGFQAAYEGAFSFDVYYDAADVKQKFDGLFSSLFLSSYP